MFAGGVFCLLFSPNDLIHEDSIFLSSPATTCAMIELNYYSNLLLNKIHVISDRLIGEYIRLKRKLDIL